MADVSGISGTTNPYDGTTYTAKSNSKNTLTMTSYIQLLAVQLQNQDMTNPMDNSEMMNQLSQMAMVQALSTLTETMTSNNTMNTTTYAAGMVGKEVTVAVTQADSFGNDLIVGEKVGVVESVNLTGSSPTFRLEDDDTDYPLANLRGIGDITSEGDTDTSLESGIQLMDLAKSATDDKNATEAALLLQQQQLQTKLLGEIFSDKEKDDDSIDLSKLI